MEFKIAKKLLSNRHKGTFVKIEWETDITSASATKQGQKVIKVTSATVRWGVKYDNLCRVKATKTIAVKKDRKPWYKHIEGANYFIQHLEDENKTYLQIFPIQKKGYVKSTYFINGIEASKQKVEQSGLVNPSKFKSSPDEVLIMTIPTKNIKSIGGKSL